MFQKYEIILNIYIFSYIYNKIGSCFQKSVKAVVNLEKMAKCYCSLSFSVYNYLHAFENCIYLKKSCMLASNTKIKQLIIIFIINIIKSFGNIYFFLLIFPI